jgi:lipoprotein-anchoring transpeptidase ErfK/SrfK
VWLIILGVALTVGVALGAYGFYVLASTGGSTPVALFGLRLPWQAAVRLTATPTKTPAAEITPTISPTPLRKLPTLTPTTTPTAVSQVSQSVPQVAPTATSTARPPLPEDLASVATQYGLDPDGSFVVVDQNRQRMHVVKAGCVARTLPVSTGDPDDYFSTPAWVGTIGEYWGSFNAAGVWADEAWYLFTLDGGGTILIHSAPYVLQGGIKVYQELDALGQYPASRGCIRLLPEDAQWFSDWRPEGVPMVILPWDGGTSRQG